MTTPLVALQTFPVLQTERLKLRGLQPADADAVYEIFANDAVTRLYDLNTFEHINQAVEFIDHFDRLFALKAGLRWAIVLRKTGEVMGTCGFNSLIHRDFRAEVGYDLNQRYWHQGYATEAMAAVLQFGFTIMNLNRIEASVMAGNEPSVRLLNRLGFTQEGVLKEFLFLRNVYYTIQYFALLKQEYLKGQ